jgi:transaldolase
MPPPTLDAFRDHGVTRVSLEDDLDGCTQNLAGLESIGISMAKVTAELEQEGVKSFADAYDALLKTLEERCAAVKV